MASRTRYRIQIENNNGLMEEILPGFIIRSCQKKFRVLPGKPLHYDNVAMDELRTAIYRTCPLDEDPEEQRGIARESADQPPGQRQ